MQLKGEKDSKRAANEEIRKQEKLQSCSQRFQKMDGGARASYVLFIVRVGKGHWRKFDAIKENRVRKAGWELILMIGMGYSQL